MARKKSKDLNCCEKCQTYWTCETKWYRGEHNRENVCCPVCNFYETCWGPILDSLKKKKKKNSSRV